jgi:hypothetical protein
MKTTIYISTIILTLLCIGISSAQVPTNSRPEKVDSPTPQDNSLYQGKKKGLFSPNRIYFGGELSYLHQSSTQDDGNNSVDFTTTVFTISPMFGFFLIENIAIYAQLSLRKTQTKGDGYNNTDTNELFEAGARYFFPNGKLNFYAGGSVGFSTEDFGLLELDQKFISLHGGLLYMVTGNIGINLGMKFQFGMGSINLSGISDTDTTAMRLQIGYLGVLAFY